VDTDRHADAGILHSEKNTIAICVITHPTRVPTILPGCLALILSTQAAAPQTNATSAQDGGVNQTASRTGDEPAPSAASTATGPVYQLPQAADPPRGTSGESTAPAPFPSVGLIPRSPADRERAIQAERHILLNVFVTDASGKPVTGLKQEDFTLLDDQQPRKIASLQAVKGSAAIAPVHVMLMLDTLNNSSASVASERRGVEKLLGQNQGRLPYPVSIVHLSGSGTSASQPTRDGNALIDELRMIPNDIHSRDQEPSPGIQTFGGTIGPSKIISQANPLAKDLNQRFTQSIPALARLAKEQQGIPGRVILVWIGPGWPPLSGPGFLPDTPEMQRNFFAYIVDLSNELREAQMTLDAVSSPNMLRDAGLRSDYYRAFLNGVPTASQANSGNLALPVLAYQSGGQVLEESKDIAADIDGCIADAESYYVLSFDSSAAAKPDEYHSLQVIVNKPGLTARTNTAYYAQP
jgi:VWFA-related protein